MIFGRCTNCNTAREDLAEVVIQINGRRKQYELCGECRQPVADLQEALVGRVRREKRAGRVIPLDPADIPLDRPPTRLTPVRKRT